MKTHTRLIPLTQGKFAIVDSIDYDFLMQWKWCATRNPLSVDIWYAVRAEMNSTPPPRKKMILMHRVVAKRAGMPYSPRYDHRDRNGLNNTRENLRPCTHSQNMANQKKQLGCSSQFKGVSWNKPIKRWTAYINHKGKKFHLGTFQCEYEAHEAYAAAAVRLFGEFARV